MHTVVVGGTGMLAGAVHELTKRGPVSLLARRASFFAARMSGVSGLDCDYYDERGFQVALDGAVAAWGAPELAIGWFHQDDLPSVAALARSVAEEGRCFQVLGSAGADPARPQRLQAIAAAARGGRSIRYRQIILGFMLVGSGSRWLTNQEISAGVIRAVDGDAPLSMVGVVEPWSARP